MRSKGAAMNAGVTSAPPIGPPEGPTEPPPPSTPPPSRGRRFLRRPMVRKALTALTVLLFLAGAGLIVYPFATDIYSDRLQRGLEQRFAHPSMTDWYASGELADDDPLTRLVIPDLDVNVLVVAGTSQAALRAGAGHYPKTPLPGEEGNVGIAGHRSIYGKPFRHIDGLPQGSEIRLETPLAVHTYEVVAAPDQAMHPCPNGACWVTRSNDWSVVDELDGSYLTLTACHPVGSDRQRIILRAELVDTEDVADRAP